MSIPSSEKEKSSTKSSSDQVMNPMLNSSMFYNTNGAYNGLVHSESTVTVENFWKGRDRFAGVESRPRDRESEASGSTATDELPPSTDPWALPELRQVEEQIKWHGELYFYLNVNFLNLFAMEYSFRI
jgi:hypothetical protein